MKTPANSFRLRLAVATALMAGVALAGFAAIAWWQMRQAKFDTLDREIHDQAERELSREWPAEHWARHEHKLWRSLGAQTLQQCLLLVQGNRGAEFRSAHWPENVDPDKLPWPRPDNRPLPIQAENAATSPVAEPSREDGEPPESGLSPSRDGHRPSFPPPLRDRRKPAFPPLEGILVEFMPPQGPPPREPLTAIGFSSLNAGDRHWRFGLAISPLGKLAIGVDLAVVEAEMADLSTAFLIASPLALGFIGWGAWFLSGRALFPIRRITATMERVTAKGLNQRIAHGNEDQEFGQLIRVFNGMLERLERSFLQASRFSADAAHELKTPLAILQGQIEQAIAQSEAGSHNQSRLTEILDEVQRLGTISRKLLLLSLADAGRLRLNITRLDLSQALEDLVEDAQMLAPELVVSGSIAHGLTVEADAALLRQVLHNLLGNAVKYNLPGGWIRIAASREGERIAVAVANAANGIPATDRERIFERFYRADPSHNREVEGMGLGLSLSREIARAHGGELILADSPEGEVRFVVTLAA
jgi:two-component system heavy metal sensor histidine kinase CusS